MRNIQGPLLAFLFAVTLQSEVAHAEMFTQCNQGRVDVAVNLDYVVARENLTQTAMQIDALMRNDADTSLAADRKGIYVGVTKSKLQMKSDFTFGVSVNTIRNAACPFIKTASYTFIYHPEIYIASDFRHMACRYGVTSMHEQRHVHAFLLTANDFIPQIRQSLNDYISRMPPTQPLTTKDAVTARNQEMMQAVTASLDPLLSQFQEVNRQRQAAIDTPAQYARDSAVCPGERPAFPVR